MAFMLVLFIISRILSSNFQPLFPDMKNNFLLTLIILIAAQFSQRANAQNYSPRDTANLRNRDRMRQWS